MTDLFDLVVLGAGPAGASAAIKARHLGLKVALLDENIAAGGQVYRAPSPALQHAGKDADRDAGDALRARLLDCGAAFFPLHRVWSIVPGFTIAAVGPDGPRTIHASNLIVAQGALERHIPVEGWTLPGVIGLAAATILIKSHGILPGRRVVVAGSGPLLLLVASKIVAAGGVVAALVDARSRSAWLASASRLATRPTLVARGFTWSLDIARARVPIYSGAAVRSIHGATCVESVKIGAIDQEWRPKGAKVSCIDADAVCVGFGLYPSNEVTRLLGATHEFRSDLGGWLPKVTSSFETTVSGLFVAGDAGGVRGAEAAPLAGELAAISVARRLNPGKVSDRSDRLLSRWQRSAKFGAAMSALAMPAPDAVEMIGADATVCRCEGIRRSTLDNAIDAGARTLDDLKATTRCGMGSCGGRVCGEAAAMILAIKTGLDRRSLGQPTIRPPIRPVPLVTIAGDFKYEDLPIPAPAPL